MRDFFDQIQPWLALHKPFALATVIRTWGSSPRPIGSTLAVSLEMEMHGSVSGGCIEGAVLKAAQQTLETGNSQWLQYGVTNEDAWSVGLSCGGKIEVFLEPFVAFSEIPEEHAAWQALHHAVQHNEGCVWITRLKGGPVLHHLFQPERDGVGSLPESEFQAWAEKAYRERKTELIERGDEAYFIQVFPRKSQLIIIGAAHVTVDLVDLARQFDFETIVIDPRGVFAEKTQFSHPPDQLWVEWPAEVLDRFVLDPYSYAVMLSHDPKIDDQALALLLRSDIAYIGALGSRRTHEKRKARLMESGFSEAEIARIHAPVGVDINARLPREIALSILAQLVQVRNAGYK